MIVDSRKSFLKLFRKTANIGGFRKIITDYFSRHHCNEIGEIIQIISRTNKNLSVGKLN